MNQIMHIVGKRKIEIVPAKVVKLQKNQVKIKTLFTAISRDVFFHEILTPLFR